MKPGDLVKLKSNPGYYYDWKSYDLKLAGYWLREPKNLDLMKDWAFTTSDACLVIQIDRTTMALVLTPRQHMGLIHVNKLEVISEAW